MLIVLIILRQSQIGKYCDVVPQPFQPAFEYCYIDANFQTICLLCYGAAKKTEEMEKNIPQRVLFVRNKNFRKNGMRSARFLIQNPLDSKFPDLHLSVMPPVVTVPNFLDINDP